MTAQMSVGPSRCMCHARAEPGASGGDDRHGGQRQRRGRLGGGALALSGQLVAVRQRAAAVHTRRPLPPLHPRAPGEHSLMLLAQAFYLHASDAYTPAVMQSRASRHLAGVAQTSGCEAEHSFHPTSLSCSRLNSPHAIGPESAVGKPQMHTRRKVCWL